MSLSSKKVTVIKEINVPAYSIRLAQDDNGAYRIYYGLTGATMTNTSSTPDYNVANRIFEALLSDLISARH